MSEHKFLNENCFLSHQTFDSWEPMTFDFPPVLKKRKVLWLRWRDYERRVRLHRSPVWRHCHSRLRRGVRKLRRSDLAASPLMWLCYRRFRLVGRATRNCLSRGWDGRLPVCEGKLNHRGVGDVGAGGDFPCVTGNTWPLVFQLLTAASPPKWRTAR